MTFHSILFPIPMDQLQEPEPAFFADLNLNQLVDLLTANKQEYDLRSFFNVRLTCVHAIHYRHEIMQDLENQYLVSYIEAFARNMRAMREHLTQASKFHYKYQEESWFLDAVEIYCETIKNFMRDLTTVDLQSRGLLSFRDYLLNYTNSDSFLLLVRDAAQLRADLASVKYCILIRESSITVKKYETGDDYSQQILATFEKFKQGGVKEYLADFLNRADVNYIEEQILDRVARLFPDVFSALDSFFFTHSLYADKIISAFDREIQFYLAYIEFIARLKQAGLDFCYPQISTKDKHVFDIAGFDIVLANKLVNEKTPVVCNDFYLEQEERIFVVSGPNQGGKTTFARTFGQLHYLTAIGYPVPGQKARLLLTQDIFTHFEKEETIQTFKGKLEDDLERIHEILKQATGDSIIILNEIFTSTTLQDAIFLSKRIMEMIIQLDALCVWVTFIDELASFGAQTVSMVSTIVPENPAQRTYKIIRMPADGLAYATAIAEKHHLTYRSLKERIKS